MVEKKLHILDVYGVTYIGIRQKSPLPRCPLIRLVEYVVVPTSELKSRPEESFRKRAVSFYNRAKKSSEGESAEIILSTGLVTHFD